VIFAAVLCIFNLRYMDTSDLNSNPS